MRGIICETCLTSFGYVCCYKYSIMRVVRRRTPLPFFTSFSVAEQESVHTQFLNRLYQYIVQTASSVLDDRRMLIQTSYPIVPYRPAFTITPRFRTTVFSVHTFEVNPPPPPPPIVWFAFAAGSVSMYMLYRVGVSFSFSFCPAFTILGV